MVIFLPMVLAVCFFCFGLVAAMEAVHEGRSSLGATIAMCISMTAVVGGLAIISYI